MHVIEMGLRLGRQSEQTKEWSSQFRTAMIAGPVIGDTATLIKWLVQKSPTPYFVDEFLNHPYREWTNFPNIIWTGLDYLVRGWRLQNKCEADIELFDSDSDDEEDKDARRPVTSVRRLQLAPMIQTRSLVPHVTPALDAFCQAYIATNQLRLSTSRCQQATKCNGNPTMRLEQPSDAQKHIFFLLEEAHREADNEMQ